jgi:hypothetical protein
MLVVDVNSDSFVVLANKLDKLKRSALPNAVRNTLNSTAFYVKTTTMPKVVDKVFEKRQANFFKANSKVIPATGFDVNTMVSEVGFFENKLKNQATNYAVKDLEKQEHGGVIKGRDFVPMDKARVSNSGNKVVRKINRIFLLKKQKPKRGNNFYVKQSLMKSPSQGGKFNMAVQKAGVGGLVLGDYKGKKILWRINSLDKTSSGQYKLTALYIYKKDRAVKTKSKYRNFMQKSSMEALKKAEEFFIKNAEFQINKFWNK